MTTTTSDRPTRSARTVRRAAVLAAALVCVAALASGCSAGGDASSGAADAAAEPAPAARDDGGLAVAEGTDAGLVGTAAESSAVEGDRQVVQTGTLRLTVEEPRVAADAVVRLAEDADGRVDARSEHAATGDTAGSATLTIRVPSDRVSATVDAVRDLGKVESIDLDAQDVTAAAQDLDARIRGLQLSVARMEDLLARTTTTTDIVSAENALAERQTRLEELQSQRARLADAVALSTLTIELYGPGIVPAAAAPGPRTFFDGLAVGWQSFVVVLKAVVVVVGVLLPWLAFAGAVTAGVVAVSRWWRRRRTSTTPSTPGTPPAPPSTPAGPVAADTPA